MAEIILQGVTKTFGKNEVIHRTDATIADGEFVVIVGPSGCGKSTVLRMIAGLETATTGEIRIGGKRVNEVEPKDRNIAMVFQNYALYPHMSVYDNMAYGLKIRKLSKEDIEKRVQRAAGILELAPFLQRKPNQLSGGQRQRVAMGRAIVREPAAFLFDEPLSNLDAKLRVQMRAEIKRLHQRVGATMIYVTHDQVEAMTLGDRIAVMRKGVLQQSADPFTLYTSPVNVFVAGFIGSPPINFFPATVAADGAAIEANGVRVPLPGRLRGVAGGLKGRPVVAGIRPEDLHLEDRPGGSLPATADVREPLGNETLVHWRSPAGELISRIPGQAAPQVGESATLHFDLEKILLFDASSELALEPAAATT